MKRELKYLAIAVYWVALLGSIAPAMVSFDDTIVVLLGIGAVLASAYITYRTILRDIRRVNHGESRHGKMPTYMLGGATPFISIPNSR